MAQEFNLPKALMYYHSDYFKNALHRQWTEATGLKINLDLSVWYNLKAKLIDSNIQLLRLMERPLEQMRTPQT